MCHYLSLGLSCARLDVNIVVYGSGCGRDVRRGKGREGIVWMGGILVCDCGNR